MQIFITGPAALGGACLLLKYHRDRLEKHFSNAFLKNAESKLALQETAFGSDFLSIPVAEQGISGALFALGKLAGLGFTIDSWKIPVIQEVT